MFNQYMRSSLRNHGRKELSTALKFWQDANTNITVISLVPFNDVAKACLSFPDSSASVERLCSNIRRQEGAHQQSTFSSTLQMRATVISFMKNELRSNKLPQNSLLHPTAPSFKRIVDKVAVHIHNKIKFVD